MVKSAVEVLILQGVVLLVEQLCQDNPNAMGWAAGARHFAEMESNRVLDNREPVVRETA